jgi:hypothetical protein
LLTSVLAEGNVLLTGVPGLGRTLVAETMGSVLGLKTARLQFTPDISSFMVKYPGWQGCEAIYSENQNSTAPQKL